MTITRRMLDTELQSWFRNARNAEKAKDEILARFSAEPGDGMSGVNKTFGDSAERLLTAGTAVNVYTHDGALYREGSVKFM